MSKPYGTLASAVDAHVAKWAQADLAKRTLLDEVIAALSADRDPSQLGLFGRLMRNEWINRWIVFSMSYGLPDSDGNPRIVFSTADEMSDDMTQMVTCTITEGSEARGPSEPQGVVTPSAARIMEGTTISGRERFDGDAAALAQGVTLAHREWAMLGRAITHYVGEEVIDEITDFADQARNEPLYATDVITPVGFAVFEKPIRVPDLHPETGQMDGNFHLLVRAVGWHVHGGIANLATGAVGEGVSTFWYTTAQDYGDGYYQDLLREGMAEFHPDDVGEGLLPVEVLPWTFGVHWNERDQVGYIPGTVPGPIAYQRRWFYAFQRLMWQRIIVLQRQSVKRPMHRRWERQTKGRKPVLDYTVLQLRRRVDFIPEHHHAGTGRHLDHRIPVRGHPRFQYCATLGPAYQEDGTVNEASHRWIWVEPHWRGPEEGPEDPRRRVISVTR